MADDEKMCRLSSSKQWLWTIWENQCRDQAYKLCFFISSSLLGGETQRGETDADFFF